MSVSDAESMVMEALWARHPQTADEIIAEIAEANGWSAMTIRTLLNRLLNKAAISASREGRRYLYSPVLTRTDYVHEKSRGLIDRLFDGRLAPLVSHFSEREGLDPDDIKALRQLVEGLDDDQPDP